MSIDICSKEHKKIKMIAAMQETSIRKFVIECIKEKVAFLSEKKLLRQRKTST
ncbi:MAG: hypothetical protein LLG04_04165 [Parachlamydia sp.]|nr:hypothetical protein [Parachlamydia sp.]